MPLSADRLQRVQDIIEEARTKSSAERAAFVARACGDDADVREEVESLLEHAEQAGEDFLKVPEPGFRLGLRGMPADGSDPLLGTHIGRYQIRSVIATGGMGTVYLAEQDIVPEPEPPAKKTVMALKPADSAADATAAHSSGTKKDSIAGGMAAAEPPSKPASKLPIKTTHEVQPGESLGRIAAKYYGRSTTRRIDAIYNANREVIPNINAVKANTRLNIPDLGDDNPTTVKVRTDTPAEDSKYRWYEVQPSDTLGKIAARKLGDEKLYGEILRLNKDRITDQNVLKPGVKIRLPAKVASLGSTASAAPHGNAVP